MVHVWRDTRHVSFRRVCLCFNSGGGGGGGCGGGGGGGAVGAQCMIWGPEKEKMPNYSPKYP